MKWILTIAMILSVGHARAAADPQPPADQRSLGPVDTRPRVAMESAAAGGSLRVSPSPALSRHRAQPALPESGHERPYFYREGSSRRVVPDDAAVLPTVYTVTNTNNSGAGSLRQALLDANAHAGADRIAFNLTGPAPYTISPTSALPLISGPVEIDGSSQPGFAGSPLIVIDGISAGTDVSGLGMSSNGTIVRSLAVQRFTGNGIEILNSGNTITGCYVGIGADGMTDRGNAQIGIGIWDSPNNTVGGTTPGAGNVISGNDDLGVYLSGTGTTNNQIQGNIIGLNAAGTAALGNSGPGILVEFGANGNTVGGLSAAARNVISGNSNPFGDGIEIGETCNGNTIIGNYVGTGVDGATDLGNERFGIAIWDAAGTTIGGTSAAERNVVSGNGVTAIYICGAATTGSQIKGNYIGLDATGLAAVPNDTMGVLIGWGAAANTIGGTTTGSGNVISGNGYCGLYLVENGPPGNLIQGNIIGLNAAGTAALGNVGPGVLIVQGAIANTIGGTTAEARNVISGNQGEFGDGIQIGDDCDGNIFIGNYIGTGIDGATDFGNGRIGLGIWHSANTVIGGTSTAERNVISGNEGRGIYLDGATTIGNRIRGNIIGLDAAGQTAVANGNAGVCAVDSASGNFVGGTEPGSGNVISGNSYCGVILYGGGTNANLIQGNIIGLDATGNAAIGNVGPGVYVGSGASGNTIGGDVAEARNVISGNLGEYGDGIEVGDESDNNTIAGNYIGTGSDGATDLGNERCGILVENASGIAIGGALATERNVVSGNDYVGIHITGSAATGNQIIGNIVGLNAAGTEVLGNLGPGIVLFDGATGNTIGGVSADARNVISGNQGEFGDGIEITGTCDGNTIVGNYIGAGIDGATDLGNARYGIGIWNAASNTIGGTTAGAGNSVLGNGSHGVKVYGDLAVGNQILGNSIVGNTGLGIDLGGDNIPNPNDAGDIDVGPNSLQNFPVLAAATRTSVQGTLNSMPNRTYRIEFFANVDGDPSGYGEGESYSGFTSATTDAGGNATFSCTFPSQVPAASFITATATDPDNSTSEFSGWLQVAAGPAGFTVVAWGANESGQADVPEPNADFVAVSGGGYHCLGLKSDGSIVAWGSNTYGQCDIPPPNADFVAVAAGAFHSLALKADGSVRVWGRNNYNQGVPPSPNSDFVKIATGYHHNLALKTDGSIKAWGFNGYSQCTVPAPNTGFAGIAGGGHHSVGLKAVGSVVAWGRNDHGECIVPTPNSGFTAISAGIYQSYGLRSDGSISAWGTNNNGECNVPAPNTGFTAVASRANHALGLKLDGSVVAWGYNGSGECNVPTPNNGYVAIAAGVYLSLGLRYDISTDVTILNPAPAVHALLQNQPNPFNPQTLIRYAVSETGPVSLQIYDVQGRLVRTLVDEVCSAGWRENRWDGRDGDGRTVASGVYFYRLHSGKDTITRKMSLTR